MTKEIKKYLAELQKNVSEPDANIQRLLKLLEKRIQFYQHERLIHLIITMTFAVLCVLSFSVMISNIIFLPLGVLFLALEIPYVFHYYFLENSVQALQRTYFEIEAMIAYHK